MVALPRLFPEALDARDCDATRALVAWRRMSSFRIAVFRVRPRRCGRDDPVVASGIAGLRSQVVDGETGILLDSLRLVRC